MWRDEANLLDMLIAARHAAAFCRELTWEQFMDNCLYQYAIAKAIENIGEAASKVSADFKIAYPDIPWPQIVALRHRIAHDYFRLDMLRLWEITTTEILTLIASLEPLVPPEEAI